MTTFGLIIFDILKKDQKHILGNKLLNYQGFQIIISK